MLAIVSAVVFSAGLSVVWLAGTWWWQVAGGAVASAAAAVLCGCLLDAGLNDADVQRD